MEGQEPEVLPGTKVSVSHPRELRAVAPTAVIRLLHERLPCNHLADPRRDGEAGHRAANRAAEPAPLPPRSPNVRHRLGSG